VPTGRALLFQAIKSRPICQAFIRRSRSPLRCASPAFRGAGISSCLENGGTLEKVRQMAATRIPRTPRPCDQRANRVSPDAVAMINVRG
jgi:hypothetical protein